MSVVGISLRKTPEKTIRDECVTHALDWLQLYREVYYLEYGERVDPNLIDDLVNAYKRSYPENLEDYVEEEKQHWD